MNGFDAAVSAELRKVWASPVVRGATVFLVGGIGVLTGSLTWAADSGNERVLAQLGTLAGAGGWERFLGVAAQITGAGALLGFGVVLSWMVGREFADGTIHGLFGLPVSRSTIALAKLTVYLLWTVLVSVVLAVALTGIGLVLVGPLDAAAGAGVVRQFLLAALTAGVAVPAAWTATLGRGLLPGIAVTIGTIVVAQVAVVAGAGAWLPLAAPALWGLAPATVSSLQLALALVVPAGFVVATLITWRRLQLDR